MVGFGALCAGSTQELRADIVFSQGAGSLQPDENVLFNEPGLLNTGMTVQGITNQSALIVNFSSDEVLETPANRIAAQDGLFDSLELSLDQFVPFTELQFNVDVPNNAPGTPTLVMTAYDTDGNVFVSDAFELGNGSNVFGVEAINGQQIQRIELTANSEIINRIGQFRITAIPEAAGAAVIGLLGALALLLGRRRRAAA